MGSCMSRGSVESLLLLPKTFPIWTGPANGREDLPPPPHCSHSTSGYLPKSQPSCPTAAGAVSSLLFHHQVSKTIMSFPARRLLGILQRKLEVKVEAGPSPQVLQDTLKTAERNLLGLQGWRRQEAAERRRSNLSILRPPPRVTQKGGIGGGTKKEGKK